jgi:hypothetical protein
MRSIPAALSWELFRRGKWNLLGAFLTGNALTFVLLTVMRREGIDLEDRSMIPMHVTMLLINAMLFGAILLSAMGNPYRLRTFPAPTSTIVAWQLLPAMTAMALECLLFTAVVNAIFKANWPFWGPALFMPVALAAFAAMFWLTEKSPWHFFILALPVLSGIMMWFTSRYGTAYHAPPTRMWREVTPAELATMMAMAGVSYYAAIVGVARSRCGEFLRTPLFLRWLGRLLDPTPDVGLPFRTPAHAQFWFEWRQKGWVLPFMVIFGLLVGLVGWLVFNRNPRDLLQGATTAGAFLPIAGLIMGLVFGNVNTLEGKLEMGHFLATRAMTSSDMSRATLKAAGISALLAWAIWTVALLGLYAILLLANFGPHELLKDHLPGEVNWWYFPLTLLGTWLGLTFVMTIGQTGRPILLGALFCGVPAITIVVALFSHFVLTPDGKIMLNQVIATLIGLIYILSTVWALAAARRSLAIDSRTVWAAIGAWVALGVSFVLFWLQHRGEHPTSLPLFVHVIGLMALVVFPLAASPLAVAWNRNR